jgi:hypothetical protein
MRFSMNGGVASVVPRWPCRRQSSSLTSPAVPLCVSVLPMKPSWNGFTPRSRRWLRPSSKPVRVYEYGE